MTNKLAINYSKLVPYDPNTGKRINKETISGIKRKINGDREAHFICCHPNCDLSFPYSTYGTHVSQNHPNLTEKGNINLN